MGCFFALLIVSFIFVFFLNAVQFIQDFVLGVILVLFPEIIKSDVVKGFSASSESLVQLSSQVSCFVLPRKEIVCLLFLAGGYSVSPALFDENIVLHPVNGAVIFGGNHSPYLGHVVSVPCSNYVKMGKRPYTPSVIIQYIV